MSFPDPLSQVKTLLDHVCENGTLRKDWHMQLVAVDCSGSTSSCCTTIKANTVEHWSSKHDKTPETHKQHTGTHRQHTKDAAKGRTAFIGRQETSQRGTGEAAQVSHPISHPHPWWQWSMTSSIHLFLHWHHSQSCKAEVKLSKHVRGKKRALGELLTAAKL